MTATDIDELQTRWESIFPGGLTVVSRSDSTLEVFRTSEQASSESAVSERGLVGWFVPEDEIVYGRIPIHVVDAPEETEQVVDAAISCLEHFESELAGRGWRITDDGRLRREDDGFVFEATVKRIVESADEAAAVLRSLAEDPIEYEVQ